jgi:hypothetical protein
MISTGLVLRKPGESRYAQFRRLLIANQVALESPSKFRSFLIQQISEYTDNNYKVGHRALSFHISSKIESIQLVELGIEKNSYLDFERNSFQFRARRNCQRCSELIYHNRAYDFDWLVNCPIHGEPLTKKCRVCLKEWPSSLALLKSDCAACGVKVSTRDLFSRNAFHTVDEFQYLSELSSLVKLPEKHYTIKRWFCGSVAKKTNISTLFMPSFSQVPALKIFRKKLVNLPFMKSTSVRIIKKTQKRRGCQPLLSEEDLSRIHKENLFKSITALGSLSNKNHEVGSCLKSNKQETCALCKSWLLICKTTPRSLEMLTEYTSSTEGNDLVYYEARKQLANVSNELIEISLPEACSTLSESDFSSMPVGSSLEYLMSYEATKFVYEVDCWMLFVRILLINFYLDYWYTYSEDRTHLSLMSNAPKMILMNGLLRNPYHVMADNKSITIGVPSCLLDPLKVLDNPFAKREVNFT